MQLSGRKVLLIASPILFLLLATQTAQAVTKSTINVESEGENSSVNVNSNIESSNTTTRTTKGTTDVTIICNGVKKTYHSDSAENVDLHCDDETTGTVKNQVTINNSSQTTITPKPTYRDDDGDKDDKNSTQSGIKQEVKAAKDEKNERTEDLFEKLTQAIREFFKDFHF